MRKSLIFNLIPTMLMLAFVGMTIYVWGNVEEHGLPLLIVFSAICVLSIIWLYILWYNYYQYYKFRRDKEKELNAKLKALEKEFNDAMKEIFNHPNGADGIDKLNDLFKEHRHDEAIGWDTPEQREKCSGCDVEDCEIRLVAFIGKHNGTPS